MLRRLLLGCIGPIKALTSKDLNETGGLVAKKTKMKQKASGLDAPTRSQRLRCLSDNSRVTILELLWSGARPFSELAEATGLEQSLLSHHLRVLRDAKFVRVAKRGRSTSYEMFPGVKASDSEMLLEFSRCRLLLR